MLSQGGVERDPLVERDQKEIRFSGTATLLPRIAFQVGRSLWWRLVILSMVEIGNHVGGAPLYGGDW